MNFVSVIEAKRDGQVLASGQIEEVIRACVGGQIPDYQLAAFLMAVYFRGLDSSETKALTLAMRDSGDLLAFPPDPRPLVDKHSTGGVGDKVSLVLTPLLASLGFRAPMISGRGLGITGGTLDKLESIPGFQANLPGERIIKIVQQTGCIICGQTETMVPADKRLYALRDVTATVPSIPLIVASILSKKLAEGISALILDVKFGSAAFMRTRTQARQLAQAMVTLGNECGVRTRALLTCMDAPLGRAAGNWLEVKEAQELLQPNQGSADTPTKSTEDLRELVTTCAAHLLVQTGKAESLPRAKELAEQCLASGEPRSRWLEMLLAQGANLKQFNQKLRQESCARVMTELRTTVEGFVRQCNARLIGEVVRDLGAGRTKKDAPVEPNVGLDRIAKPGDFVAPGSVLARIHARDESSAAAAKARLADAFEICAERAAAKPLIAEVVGL